MSTPCPERARPWWAPLENPKEIRKAVVFAVTLAGQALALNLITGRLADWITLGLGAAGLCGIFAVPNQQGIPGTYVPGAPPAPGPTARKR